MIAALLLLLNAARIAAGDQPLTESPILDMRAQTRAEYLCAHGQWSHAGWLTSFKGLAWRFAGENLARGSHDAAAIDNAWMSSPTHRDNMLKPQYEQVGFGQSCDITVELFIGQ